MNRTLGQRIFLVFWVLWAILVSLAGLISLMDGHPFAALGTMLTVALAFAIPIALLQFICLGSAMPSALSPRR